MRLQRFEKLKIAAIYLRKFDLLEEDSDEGLKTILKVFKHLNFSFIHSLMKQDDLN